MSEMGFHCEGCKTYEMAKVFTGYSCFVPLAWRWIKNPTMSVAKTFRHRPWFSKWPWAQVLIPPIRVKDTCCRNTVTPGDRPKPHWGHRTDCMQYTGAYLRRRASLTSGRLHRRTVLGRVFLSKAVCAGWRWNLHPPQISLGATVAYQKPLRATHDQTGLTKIHSALACSIRWSSMTSSEFQGDFTFQDCLKLIIDTTHHSTIPN